MIETITVEEGDKNRMETNKQEKRGDEAEDKEL